MFIILYEKPGLNFLIWIVPVYQTNSECPYIMIGTDNGCRLFDAKLSFEPVLACY